MKRASVICLVACLAVAGLSLWAADEAPKDKDKPAKGRTHVLLVGISEYADKQIKPRPHAEADVKALYDVFTGKEYSALDKKDVTLLTGKAATRAAFLDALKAVAKGAKAEDTVVLAFVGQGGPIGDSGDRRCYFLADSTFKGRDKDAVASEEIEEALKNFKPKRFATLLDVDFKGFVDDGKSGRAIAEPTLGKAPYREFLGDDGSEDHLPMAGRIAFLATNGLTPSLDLKGHGLFAQVVVDALKGGADDEGYEADGQVSIDELAKYINKNLPELARKHGKTEKEKEQDHFVLAGPSAHFVVGEVAKTRAVHKERLAKFEALVAKSKMSADQADEGRALLERMPALKAKQSLRKAYQQYADGKLNAGRFNAERKDVLKSMELPRADGVAFATKVIEATELMTEEYVKDVNVGQLCIWAVRELYGYLEEKIPEDVEKQLKDARTLGQRQLLLLLAEARIHLGKREDLDDMKDLNITLPRMLHRLDPHTTYIDPETVKKFEQDIAGNFTGIGIQIRKDAVTDQLLVATPIYGAPAYRAETPMSKANKQYPRGLWAGDVVTTIVRDVDSLGNPLEKTERTPTKGLSLNKAVKMIQGQKGTDVTLVVQREGIEKPFEVKITRGRVEVESVLGAKRKADDQWDFVIDHANKIGYIRLSSFNRNSFNEIDAVMRDLMRTHKIKGFVLDLRFNPGGLLDVAIKITDAYVDDGLIVSVHPRGGADRATRFFGRHRDSLLDFPMVCLVNGYSASGSEIVSAALQDHKRALIFGERSYGKGSVQNIREFLVRDGKGDQQKAEIKYTTAAFRRPNGDNLNKASTNGKDEEKWGVVPDRLVKLNAKDRRDLSEHLRNLETIERHDKREKREKELNEFKDKQLDEALEYLRGQIKMSAKVQK